MAVKVTSETLPERQVKLQIEVDEDRHREAMETAYKKLAPKVRIPGFRAGKAPRPLIERQLGHHRLLDEAMDILVPKVYSEVLEQEDIQPVAQPSVELVSHEPLVFTATVPLQPLVDIGDYQSLRKPRPQPEVTDEQVEEALQELRTRYGTIEPVDRPAADGDIVRADIKASADDTTIFSSNDVEFRLNEESLKSLPGLANTIVGMSKGESAETTEDVPEDFGDERLNGKTVVYNVTLHEVKEEQLAELTDELAKEVGEGFDTVLALRARIREDIEKAEDEQILRNYETEVVDSLAEQASIEYAPQMLEHEIDHILEDQANLDPRDPRAQLLYLQRMNLSEEEVRDSVRPEAEQRIKRSLVLTEFAQAENIEVEASDIEEEIETMASQSGEQGDMIRQLFSTDEAKDSLARTLHTRKTLAKLVELASQPETEESKAAPKRRRTAPRNAEGEEEAEASAETEVEASAETEKEASPEKASSEEEAPSSTGE
jgi:trigger factor